MGREKGRPLKSLDAPPTSAGLEALPTILQPLPLLFPMPDIPISPSGDVESIADVVQPVRLLTKHPLDGHPEVPKLTSIQQLITQAIIESGEPTTFDRIYDCVSARWRGLRIRRRDGTPYTTDCRRAIQANLRYSPHQVALFIKVQDAPAAWRLSRTVEEAMQPMMDKAREREGATWAEAAAEMLASADERDEDDMGQDDTHVGDQNDGMPEPEHSKEVRAAAEEQWASAAFRQPPRPSLLPALHRSLTGSSNDYLRPQAQPAGRKALQTRYDDGDVPDGPIDLTDLQRLISEGIVRKGNWAHIDDIYAHVAKYWNDLKNPNGSSKTTDCRRAVITSLTKNSISITPIFAKGPKDSTWILAQHHPWLLEMPAPVLALAARPLYSSTSDTTSADSSGSATPAVALADSTNGSPLVASPNANAAELAGVAAPPPQFLLPPHQFPGTMPPQMSPMMAHQMAYFAHNGFPLFYGVNAARSAVPQPQPMQNGRPAVQPGFSISSMMN